MSPELAGYELEVYSANQKTIGFAKQVAKRSGLSITIHPKGALSHSQVLERFSRSKIYVGLSESDGISTSLLEAMAMGAIPVQTNTSCAQEWIVDKKTGFIFTPNDLDALRSAVLDIIEGKFDSQAARAENYAVIDSRYNPDKLSLVAAGYYQSLIASN
jgi:glycosyltransferase involved in cell wall biosynthesis